MTFQSWLKHPGTRTLIIIILFLVAQLALAPWEAGNRPRGATAAAGLKQGDALTEVAGVGVDGQPLRRSMSGPTPTLIFFYAASCVFCERNYERWARVRSQIDPGAATVLYATTDPLDFSAKAFAKQRGFEDVMFLDRALARSALRATATPYTVLVRRGRVEASFLGVLDQDRVSQLINLVNKGTHGG